MERWVIYAIISMIFAGFTSVIAKQGLANITGELGLFIRTCFVFLFVIVFALIAVPRSQFGTLTSKNITWLGLSGITTAVSWIYYYKALEIGKVSTIAIIDKASFVIAVVLAWAFLGEQITPRVALGCGLILSGLLVVSQK
jgi:transporter family protein